VTLFEFKTGWPGAGGEKHAAQMANYLGIMREVYKDRRMEGLIAYVDAREVRRVRTLPFPS